MLKKFKNLKIFELTLEVVALILVLYSFSLALYGYFAENIELFNEAKNEMTIFIIVYFVILLFSVYTNLFIKSFVPLFVQSMVNDCAEKLNITGYSLVKEVKKKEVLVYFYTEQATGNLKENIEQNFKLLNKDLKFMLKKKYKYDYIEEKIF